MSGCYWKVDGILAKTVASYKDLAFSFVLQVSNNIPLECFLHSDFSKKCHLAYQPEILNKKIKITIQIIQCLTEDDAPHYSFFHDLTLCSDK